MNDLVFHPVLPFPWLVLLGLAALGAILWSLARGVRSRPHAFTLGMLRLGALGALLLLLAQPQRRREEITVLRPQLAVLVDNSQSMAEKVDPKQPTRAERAAEWLRSPSVQAARADFDLRLFAFADAPAEIADAGALKCDGTQSRIAEALARVEEHFRGQPLAGILLLSDGLERGGEAHPSAAPAPAAETPGGSAGVPVFSFELESPFRPKQQAKRISLAHLDYPPRVVTGWDAEVRAAIAARGMSGQTLRVEFWREGQKTGETAVAFNEDEQTRQVAFPLSQSVPGAVHYELRIDDPNADADARKAPFTVEAMEPGNRILYLQNTLGFDFKFLRKAILGDRNLQLSAFVRWADGRIVALGGPDGKAPAALDLSENALSGTAVVILGDLAPDALTPGQYAALAGFVKRGGGLVLLGGAHSLAASGFAATALGPLLPVRLPAEYREGNFPMHITDTGLHHPVFGSLFTALDDFPPLLSANLAQGVAPLAEVLVETRVNGNAYPVVAAIRHGQGRLIVVASDTLWRWRLAAKGWSADRSPYDTFWAQLMDWLIPKEQQKRDGNRLELFTERAQYFSGEQPELRALLQTADAGTPAPASLPLKLRTPDDKVFEYTLRPAQWTGRDGKKVAGFRATVEPNVPGVFRAEAAVTVQGSAISGETRFAVVQPPTEQTGKPIDRAALQRIARAHGGGYYPLGSWDRWRADLHVAEQHTSRIELTDLWTHPLALGALLLLLAAEWAARKYWNLP